MTAVCRWLKRLRAGASPVVEATGAPATAGSDVDRRLLFSLGPVQGFIAEARRTRDVWAGSFLLSWLSAIAMREIVKAIGTNNFRLPRIERDPLYEALLAGTEAPYQASLPNHCEVTIPAGVPFEPNAPARAIQAKWAELAEAVWAAFLAPALSDTGFDRTRGIWNRQIGTPDAGPFWEVQWVLVSAADTAEDWLERRKLWRTWPVDQVEPPDLCTMMGDWQELSGSTRATKVGKEAQKEFWEKVQEHLVARLDLGATLIELRPTERLCAIAFVKRMFPLLPPATLAGIIGWPARANGPRGRRIDDSYRPSTAYLAAGHWLERAWTHAEAECQTFAGALERIPDTRALQVAERIDRLGLVPGHPDFAQIDGKLFFEGSYEAETELKQIKDPDKAKLVKALAAIANAKLPLVAGKPQETVGRPSSYYAVLRMDGDSMGTFAQNKLLPVVLAKFANRVRIVVRKHHGELIFAGGDDLMALLPLEDALAAAIDLRDEWERWVGRRIPGATISAGLVYVHYEVALRWALEEARRQLDDIAKKVNGRDSIAMAVLGRRDVAVSWATTWGSAAGKDDLVQALVKLIADFAGGAKALCDNRFVYGVAERLGPFVQGPLAKREAMLAAEANAGPALADEDADVLLRTVGGENAGGMSGDDMGSLLLLLRPHYREKKVYLARTNPLQLDLLLLLRFLGTEWRRKDAA